MEVDEVVALERSPSSQNRAQRLAMMTRGVTARYLQTHGEAPSDKGWAWVIAAASFFIHFIVLGIAYTAGVWLVPMSLAFNEPTSTISWFFGFFMFVFLTGNIGVGRIVERYGFRIPLSIGAILLPLGMFLASFATATWQLAVAWSVVMGTGGAFCFLPAVTAAGSWFVKRRGLGVGLAVAGSGVGNFALAPIFEILESRYGWRVALRISSAFIFFILLIVTPLLKRRVPLKRALLSLDYCRHLHPFWVLFFVLTLIGFGYLAPFILVFNHAVLQGLDRSEASWVVSSLGIASTCGRIALGLAADRFGPLRTLFCSLIIMSATLFVLPYLRTLPLLILWGVVYGLHAGSVPALVPPIVALLFESQYFNIISGICYSAFALGNLSGPPIVSYLYEATGDYRIGFIACGALLLVAALFTCVVEKKKNDDDGSSLDEVEVKVGVDEGEKVEKEGKEDEVRRKKGGRRRSRKRRVRRLSANF